MDNKFWKSRIKIISCILSVVLIGLIANVQILLTALIIVLATLILFRMKFKIPMKSIFFIMLFAFTLGFIQTISIGEHSIIEWPLFSLKVHLYKEGLSIGIITFLRITSSMGIILLLIRSIKINDFQAALAWMKVPKLFLEIMMFSIKYIYIFKEEAVSVIKAQRSRLGYKGFYRSIISMSCVAGIVLTRAYDRSKVLSKAMQSRGYNGNT